MKQPQWNLLPFLLSGLLVMAVSSWLVFLVSPSISFSPYILLIIALFFMIGAVICHKVTKGRTPGYIISYFLNAFGSGCALGALLETKSIFPAPELILVLLPAAAMGIVMCLLLSVFADSRRPAITAISCLLTLALIGIGIYIWICKSPAVGCALLFSGLFFLPFPVGCSSALEKPEQKYRYLSFSGFGAFILIALVVIAILSEGEILDAFDLDFSGFGKSKKTRK